MSSLRDPVTGRPTRAGHEQAPEGGVLLLDGNLLLGRRLAVDLAVHLHLSEAALRRRTSAQELWTLPAYARDAEQVQPQDVADVVVLADDPRHPAVVTRHAP